MDFKDIISLIIDRKARTIKAFYRVAYITFKVKGAYLHHS